MLIVNRGVISNVYLSNWINVVRISLCSKASRELIGIYERAKQFFVVNQLLVLDDNSVRDINQGYKTFSVDGVSPV